MNIISLLFGVKVAYASVDSFLLSVNTFILNPLIKLLFAVAFVVFLYGVVMFLANQESEDKRSTGKKHMIWGLVGLAIMFSVWTFINLVVDTLNIKGDVTPDSTTIDGSVHLHDFSIPSNYIPP